MQAPAVFLELVPKTDAAGAVVILTMPSNAGLPVRSHREIAKNWLPRYTGMPIERIGEYILLTNFDSYLERFADKFNCEVCGQGRPMQAATNDAGLTMIKFGMGPANAATVIDLLSSCRPKGILFLGKCGGLKKSSELGHFILPIGAIRRDGVSDEYCHPRVPALPSFKLHKFVSDKIVARNLDYRTGVVYTTSRRLWEHDERFKKRLSAMRCISIDMETATIFIVAHYHAIARGALLLVSDVPLMPEGIKTEESDLAVTKQWADVHLEIAIEAMAEIGTRGERIKHFRY